MKDLIGKYVDHYCYLDPEAREDVYGLAYRWLLVHWPQEFSGYDTPVDEFSGYLGDMVDALVREHGQEVLKKAQDLFKI